MEPGSFDRRAAKRVPYIVEASLEGRSSPTDRIGDLSSTGAFIETIGDYPAGSTFELLFRVAERDIRATVEVRYSMPPVGVGVAFVDMSHDNRCALEQLVRSHAM